MVQRKTRIGVSGHDLKFWNPLQAALEATGLYEFRTDEWANHDVHDPERSCALIEWADVLVAEWALGNAVYYSHCKSPHQKLIVRLHLQERETRFPAEIEYGNVDHLVFVGPHILRECVERFSIPSAICSVVGNAVDSKKYALTKLDGARHTIGMIGIAPARKRLDRALDLLDALAEKDARYMLRIKGASPASMPWLWEREPERDYYREIYSRINGGNLRHRVIFDPPADDVDQWLRMVGTILSPSDFESFHMAVAEGTASGSLPLVWNWEGADELYPELRMVHGIRDAVEQVEKLVDGELEETYLERAQHGVSARYDIGSIVNSWHELLSVKGETAYVGSSRSLRLAKHPDGSEALSVAGNQAIRPAKSLRELRVAIICDEFTYNSFKYEFVPLIIEPDNWRELFERGRPDLFFCESAWSGVDSDRRPWKGRVYSSIHFKKENRGEILDILDYCKKAGIPTVFWNKEDPSHYDDRVHDFVDTAKLFDIVFTTDEGCVERYRSDHGLKRVHCLPFATQPRIFNPIDTQDRSEKVVFAGSWYANHADRCEAMNGIFESIIESGHELEIYDRFYGSSDTNHLYPEAYRAFIRPAVPHSEIAAVYKSSKFGLNLNTETASPTMFARRVFELMSCNTLCLSNYSYGMEKMFGSNVVFIDRNPSALRELTTEEIANKREDALVDVLSKHTYKERFKTIALAAGISFVDRESELTVACLIGSESDAEAAINYFNRQAAHLVSARLLLVLAPSIPEIDLQRYYVAYNRMGVTVVSRSYLEKYSSKASAAIETSHVALMNFKRDVKSNYIANAFSHTCYVNDAIIAADSNEKYRYLTNIAVNDVIAEAKWFPLLLRNHGRVISSRFYGV